MTNVMWYGSMATMPPLMARSVTVIDEFHRVDRV